MIAELKPNAQVKIFDATCPSCYDVFCFGCGVTGHQPVTCEKIKVWEAKAGIEDAGNKSWILLNTKTCPYCNKPVEKNGGCMYVLC
jgi:ariadne-1